MRFLSLFLTTMLLCVGLQAFGASNDREYGAEFSFNHGSGFQNHLLGTKVIRDQARFMKVQYDFAQQGGAVGTVNLLVPKTPGGPGALKGTLPKNALIIGCYIDVLTPATGAGSIALGTGQTTVDLKAATAAASYTGIVACIPTGSAASSIKLTADRIPTATISVGTITAGKFNVLIEYVLSDY